jgi:hypothetical protein
MVAGAFRSFASTACSFALRAALVCSAGLGTYSLAQGSVGPIVFARGEADVEPVDASDRFGEGIGIVYAFFEFKGLSAGDILSGVWYQDETTVLTQATTLGQVLGVTGEVAKGKLYFSILFDDGAAPGVYRLELSLNATLVQTGEFTVLAASEPGAKSAAEAGGQGESDGSIGAGTTDDGPEAAGTIPQVVPQVEHLVFEDDFDDPSSGWGTASGSSGSVAYDAGRLVITLNGRNQPAVSVHGGIFDDYVSDVEALTLAGPEDNALGVVARYQDDDNYYAFLVSADGFHAVLHFVDGRLVWDQEWQFDDLGEIERGMAGNDLRVLAEGPRLTFLVNGRVRAEVRDALWSSGQIGVFAGVFEESGVQVGFDRWRVWGLPPGE